MEHNAQAIGCLTPVSDGLTNFSAENLCLEQVVECSNLIAAGAVAAGVAHKISNVLMIATATLEVIEMRVSSDNSLADVSDAIAEVYDTIMEGAKILRQLQDIAQSSGLPGSEASLQRAIHTACSLCAAHPLAKSVRVVADPVPGGLSVVADAGAVEEALIGLVLNAMQASDGGTVRIGCEAFHAEDSVEIFISADRCSLAGRGFQPRFSGEKSDLPGNELAVSASLCKMARMGGSVMTEQGSGQARIVLKLPRYPSLTGIGGKRQ